jgi:hypothetical protein
MEVNTSDCLDELMSTEYLTSFNVVDYFCENCGELTPHHIEEPEQRASLNSSKAILIPPVSKHECVICREEEENMLDGFDS